MTIRRKGSVIAAGLLAAALVLTGCSTTTSSEPQEDVPQVLRYVPGLFPVSLDVQTYPAEEGVQITAQQVLETLVTYKDGEASPLLAESWDTPDDLTWTFHLREAKFSDGSDFTAADVKGSIDRLIGLKGALAPVLAQITSTSADDDETFTITTSQPLGTLLSTLSLVFIGQGDKVADLEYWKQPVGTGPFTVTEYVADDHVTLKRNDDYWGKKALLTEVEILNMPEVASKITALQNGEVDILTTIPPDQVSSVDGQDGIKFITSDSFLYYFIWFNQNNKPFDDVKVRQAMWHAVDFKSINEDLYGDGASLAKAPVTQSVFGAPELSPYKYDKALAKRLLSEAGYPDGFSTSIQWPRETGPNVKALAQAMISAWAEVGIKVEPLEKERAQWLADFGALNWDMNLQTNATGTGDADFTLNRLYTCAAKRMGYCNPDLDALLNEARASQDQDEREDLYAKASKIIWTTR
jgi:peptide/nickel transport system substrate-binding protein